MIAYHYPPVLRSSGVHRTAKFAQYLPEFGWNPTVLTVNPRAHMEVSPTLPPEPPGITVHRAFALDTAQHLAYKGKYLKMLALPDRWVTWFLGAIPVGLNLIRRERPDIIWSTYPIATAHLIGMTLHKLSGIPWVTDFRDPMTDSTYPRDGTTRSLYQWIERRAVANCNHTVFTTPDTRQKYLERFKWLPAERCSVIPNGFDEELFRTVEQNQMAHPSVASEKAPIHLVHSGLLYRSERNPEPFFAALAELLQQQQLSPQQLRITLRASGDETHYSQRLKALGIDKLVSLEPALPYVEALNEMLHADGLLLFQAANCNHQIPAKVYEYLRARRPIFALTDHRGNTAQLLRDSAVDTITDIASENEIKKDLVTFLKKVKQGSAPLADDATIATHSRRHRTQEFVEVLNKIIT